MNRRSLLTQKRLKECMSYDPATGIFIRLWAGSKWHRLLGKPSGCADGKGYMYMMIDRVLHVAHRLAWLYIHGRFPLGDLDHINGNPSDNRIVNLRLATRAQNCQNARLRKDSSTGIKGITHRKNGRWLAQIQVNKKKITLGVFDTAEEASRRYQRAAKELHGAFANTGRADFDYEDFDRRR